MAAPSRFSLSVERLAGLLGGAEDDPFGDELASWLAGSARFRSFARANADKIRKKLRGATDPAARLDVRAELRVAQLLLADRRLEVAFEAYGSGTAGPDFTVTMRGERPFNLEVTRLRHVPDEAAIAWAVLAKLRQLPPSVANALLLAVDGGADTIDVDAVARAIRARADRKDEEFFTARGFVGTRGFYDRYLRLGAVIVWSEAAAGDARASLWVNRSARIPIAERAGRAALVALRAT